MNINNTKKFNGKLIYQPKAEAGEYAAYACNFYKGCSAQCDYCYNRKGERIHSVGKSKPTLRSGLEDEETSLKIFEKELLSMLPILQRKGLFFSFVSDPFLPETKRLTQDAIYICQEHDVPVTVLTKQTGWVEGFSKDTTIRKDLILCGFTLTGHDELEPGASTNQERIEAMKELHELGYKTFASIEPIIDFNSSLEMIKQTVGYCDIYKIGLLSGIEDYRQSDVDTFVMEVMNLIEQYPNAKVYWKNSFNWYYPPSKRIHQQIVDQHYNPLIHK